MANTLLLEESEGFATIKINDPENGNRVSDEMAAELTNLATNVLYILKGIRNIYK